MVTCGTISASDIDSLIVVDDPAEALDHIMATIPASTDV
jgi:predicted Rossmann-fold nucleotide-binding protein